MKNTVTHFFRVESLGFWLGLPLCAFFLMACASKNAWVAQIDTSDIDLNKDLINQYKQLQWSDSSEDLASLFSDDHRQIRDEFENLAVNARDPALRNLADPVSVAIPDRVDTLQEMVAEDDIVGITYRIQGTHLGNLYGIPATGKPIDIYATSFYKFEDGKIVESWSMADEAGLLRQLEHWLPERSDSLRIAPEIKAQTWDGNDVLAKILSRSEDSYPNADTYKNKVRVSAYKSADRPADQVFEGRPYAEYLRPGFHHFGERGRELGVGDQNISQAFPDRRDQVGILIAEDDKVMIQFLLSGTNKVSLFGNTPTNEMVQAWEVGVHHFEGTYWKTGWWFGDDVGMMLQIDAPGEFLIPNSVD